jgi:aspartate kinase
VKIVKIGGGVLFGVDAVAKLPDVLARITEPYVLVVSALGKTTNALERVTQLALEGMSKCAAQELADTVRWHEGVAEVLGVSDSVLRVAREMGSTITDAALGKAASVSRAAFRDHVLSAGEELSSHLVAGYLAKMGHSVKLIDATEMVITDENFGGATPIRPLSDERLREGIMPALGVGKTPVIAGFVGATEGGVRTTLGREGSDFTAALVAAALDVDELVLLKSVAGVMSADPLLVPSAYLIPCLSFNQAERLFRAGAKVVHPKTIDPVREKDISVHVQRFGSTESGTVMSSKASWKPGMLHAVVAESMDPSVGAGPAPRPEAACTIPRSRDPGLIRLTVVGEPPIREQTASLIERTLRDVGSLRIVHDRELTAWHGWVEKPNVQRALCGLHDQLCSGVAGRGALNAKVEARTT